MNEKISDLIDEAGVSIIHNKCFKGHIDIEKFAELIIEECGRATFNYLNDGGSQYTLISNLRQHFNIIKWILAQ